MRTRKEIEDEIENAVWVKDEIHPEGYKQSHTVIPVNTELLLDIRELLVPRKNGKKVIEVQLTDKEVELLSKLENHA